MSTTTALAVRASMALAVAGTTLALPSIGTSAQTPSSAVLGCTPDLVGRYLDQEGVRYSFYPNPLAPDLPARSARQEGPTLVVRFMVTDPVPVPPCRLVTVPAAVGMPAGDAASLLRGLGLEASPAGGEGSVVGQSPEAGSIALQGTSVVLTLATPTPAPAPAPVDPPVVEPPVVDPPVVDPPVEVPPEDPGGVGQSDGESTPPPAEAGPDDPDGPGGSSRPPSSPSTSVATAEPPGSTDDPPSSSPSPSPSTPTTTSGGAPDERAGPGDEEQGTASTTNPGQGRETPGGGADDDSRDRSGPWPVVVGVLALVGAALLVDRRRRATTRHVVVRRHRAFARLTPTRGGGAGPGITVVRASVSSSLQPGTAGSPRLVVVRAPIASSLHPPVHRKRKEPA